MKNTPSKIIYYIIQNCTEPNRQNRKKHTANDLRSRWVPLPAKFLSTASELG